MTNLDNQNIDPQLISQIDKSLENFTLEPEGSSDMNLSEVVAQPSKTTRTLVDAACPAFKTDETGRLILRFDVLKSALVGRDTQTLRKDLSPHINAMMTTARAQLVSDSGLVYKNLVRLEAAGIGVALCPSEDGDGHLLILHTQGVGFSRKVYLRKFITTT